MNTFWKKTGLILAGFAGVVIILALGAVIRARVRGPIPLPLSVVYLGVPWDDLAFEYSGKGKLICHMAARSGVEFSISPSMEFRAPFKSTVLKKERNLLIYLPPGYSETRREPYPVIFYCHGFTSVLKNFVETLMYLEAAMARGEMPPCVVVRHEASLSGDGTDDPATPYDERTGGWHVNSNAGRFEDHFFGEVAPHVFRNFNVRRDPEGVVLLGTSMGGFGVLYYSITRPGFSHIVAPVYPCADLRYTVRGDRLADYAPDGYAPVERDNPSRVVNGAIWGGVFGLTEEFLYYAVFNSDSAPGPVWREDRPVWERMRAVNPADLLSAGTVRLPKHRYYIVVGMEDDFNFDAHVAVIKPLLLRAGARVYPADNFIPGGRHDQDFQRAHMGEIMAWIGRELGARK